MRSSRTARSAAVHPKDDPGFLGIVGRHLNPDTISGDKTDETFPHFPRNVGEHEMAILQFDPEHGAGQHGVNGSFQLYGFVVVILHTGRFGGARTPMVATSRARRSLTSVI